MVLFAAVSPYCAETGAGNGKAAELQARIVRLEDELAFMKRENSALRGELIETLSKYSTQAGELRRLQGGAAGTIETLEPVYMGARAMELAADLEQCISSMNKLSVSVLTFTDDFSKTLPDLIKDDVETARMRLKLEELRKQALSTARLAAPAAAPERAQTCRILELEPKSGIVILSGGWRNGIRSGMLFRAGKTELQVIAVRNFVSAALADKGSPGELREGQEAVPVRAEKQEH